MLDVVSHMIDAANAATSRYSDEEVDETVAFLDWLRDHHFIFLGVREYEIVEADGEYGDRGRARLGPRHPARREGLVVLGPA